MSERHADVRREVPASTKTGYSATERRLARIEESKRKADEEAYLARMSMERNPQQIPFHIKLGQNLEATGSNSSPSETYMAKQAREFEEWRQKEAAELEKRLGPIVMPSCGHPSCMAVTWTYQRQLRSALPVCYVQNVPWGAGKLLSKRKLVTSMHQGVPFVSIWRPPHGQNGATWLRRAAWVVPGAPKNQMYEWLDALQGSRAHHRGVIEMLFEELLHELINKNCLAAWLRDVGLERLCPPTAISVEELEDGGPFQMQDALLDVVNDGLWFLKDGTKDANEGVTVVKGRAACRAAWYAVSEENRSNFVAQREVANPLLDAEGRKVTLRVYLLLMVGSGVWSHSEERQYSKASWALVRRQFFIRTHPEKYDPSIADPKRHVHSVIGKFQGCTLKQSDDWEYNEQAWPGIRRLVSEFVEPFLPVLGERKVPCDPSTGAGMLEFDLLGVDIIVDSDMKSWLVEANLLPSLDRLDNNPEVSAQRAAVVDDIFKAVVDPAIDTTCFRFPPAETSEGVRIWEPVGLWEEKPGEKFGKPG
eukprot:gnl/TRDRNA2_/TRDRNA2_131246_c0_seq1.p1 gnl/TRDRNA2_/TRDRNA2_131246_c0~~gnl/TRDRNA2_/TRDRNA2_131246_c0_seq1.p1  ORF type:complete len:534 (-),score=94.98 gnl/TRDRNA2_/TRDRNA2_131246_c0_seq1:173-1774(-)